MCSDLNMSDGVKLTPLPECTIQLGSDFRTMDITPLQVYTDLQTQNSGLTDPLMLRRRVHESYLPN